MTVVLMRVYPVPHSRAFRMTLPIVVPLRTVFLPACCHALPFTYSRRRSSLVPLCRPPTLSLLDSPRTLDVAHLAIPA
ncbi:hypothetical protein C8F01DRAFT_1126876 [Mycena amicta]|nr:hypothetical protein C8F01DRAFT_1126876 [Mycena amicta]